MFYECITNTQFVNLISYLYGKKMLGKEVSLKFCISYWKLKIGKRGVSLTFRWFSIISWLILQYKIFAKEKPSYAKSKVSQLVH